MELKKKVVVMKVAVLVFLMGSFTAIVEASSMGTQLLMNDNSDTATKHYISNSLASKPCCDSCPCTKSIPPQCRCTDIGETCHSACNSCLCTRSFPPQCRCTDITDFCYRRCTSSEALVH